MAMPSQGPFVRSEGSQRLCWQAQGKDSLELGETWRTGKSFGKLVGEQVSNAVVAYAKGLSPHWVAFSSSKDHRILS